MSTQRKSSVNKNPIGSLSDIGINNEIDVIKALAKIHSGESNYSANERKLIIGASIQLHNYMLSERIRLSKNWCVRIREWFKSVGQSIKARLKK